MRTIATGINYIRRLLHLVLMLGSVLLLSGCIIADAPQIIPADLVSDAAYTGKFIHKMNQAPVLIKQSAPGVYVISMDNKEFLGYVLETDYGRLLLFTSPEEQEVCFFRIALNGENLQLSMLKLDTAHAQLQAALLRRQLTVSTFGGQVSLQGLQTTTDVKALFSDPDFNQGIHALMDDKQQKLHFDLIRQ